MRAEIKVALIVGVVAVAGAAIWWFSGNANELDSLPIDKRAMDATAPGATPPVRDAKPGTSDARRPGRTARDTSARTPARRPTPSARPGAPAQPKLDQPATTARPGAARPAPGAPAEEPRTREPAAKPTPPSQATERPTGAPADQPSGEPSTAPERSQPTDSSPPAVEPPRRRETLTPRYNTYTIERGDCLISIAREQYGDGQLWQVIKAANPDLDENRLKVGAVIKLPTRADAQRLARSEAEGAAPAPTTPSPAGQRPGAGRATYVVEQGDTLIAIAQNVLNDGKRWREIFELNRDQLDSADLIRPGMVLQLPPLLKKD